MAARQLSSVQALLSLQTMAAPTQLPAVQVSALVQALPSSQLAVLLAKTQSPVATLQLSVVHGLLSLQTRTAPATQPEALHWSPTVHGLLSVQGLVLALCVQPVAGLQLSSVHGLLSLQLTCVPGRQTPLWQLSPTEHTLLSALHGAFWFWDTYAQTPVAGAQELTVHVPLPLASQVTMEAGLTLQLYGSALVSQNRVPLQRLPSSWDAHSLFWVQPQLLAPLLHLPTEQASPTVHALPSSQALELFTWVQPVTALQASLVHGLPSSQKLATTTAVPLQEPPLHASFWVHALLSLQDRTLLTWVQPVAGVQASFVQRTPSSQLTLRPTQAPPLQRSFWLHALLSLQAKLLLA